MDKTVTIEETFRKEFTNVVRIFLGLQDLYEHDEPSVVEKISEFKRYLVQFTKKYPAIDVVLDERDLTTDDLKVFLRRYNSEGDILSKFALKRVPIMIKMNTRYNKLQILINYNSLQTNINEGRDFFCMLATEEVDQNVKVTIPLSLKFISREIGEGFSTSNRGIVHK